MFHLIHNQVTIGTLISWICLFSGSLLGAEQTSASLGYRNLRTHEYLRPDFDDDVFAQLWTVWPEPERSQAAAADSAERRRMTFSYYGLIEDPDDATGTKPALGYVSDHKGNWVMNCLSCHGGKVAGQVIPGLANSHICLQSLTEDVRTVKTNLGKPWAHMDLATLQMPLNMTSGTTNSVVFGIVLGAYRRPDMSVDLKRPLPPLTHHDVDPPAFWNVRRKKSLYVDGFAPKTARPLMQFILLPDVTPEKLDQWEPEFAEILSWIESLEAPKYPFHVDRELASIGESLFNKKCSACHGTYGLNGSYDQQVISIDDVQTDPVRLKALTPEHRNWMKRGWLSHFGDDPVDIDPTGYVAPPLNGVWASAPYFHNGSVPTLWHVLHAESRPAVWKRTEDGYDQDRVGLEVESLDAVPASVKVPVKRRKYFDTQLPGKNQRGHRYPESLTEDEKHAVLEYLKTL